MANPNPLPLLLPHLHIILVERFASTFLFYAVRFVSILAISCLTGYFDKTLYWVRWGCSKFVFSIWVFVSLIGFCRTLWFFSVSSHKLGFSHKTLYWILWFFSELIFWCGFLQNRLAFCVCCLGSYKTHRICLIYPPFLMGFLRVLLLFVYFIWGEESEAGSVEWNFMLTNGGFCDVQLVGFILNWLMVNGDGTIVIIQMISSKSYIY